jgi:hypothetical protein
MRMRKVSNCKEYVLDVMSGVITVCMMISGMVQQIDPKHITDGTS